MRVLSISTDRSILKPMSAAAVRMGAYAMQLDAFDIIVCTRRSDRLSPHLISTSVHAYPTASRSRLTYGIGALRIAWRLPRPDVITVQDPFETGFIGLIISWFLKVPLHVQVHTDFLAPEFVRHSFLNRIRVMLAGYILPRARRIRVVSQRIRKGLDERYHLKVPITVLPIFVDIERFSTARAGSLGNQFVQFRKKVLVVARLEVEKNVELALRSFAEISPQDACLIIVGEGSERKRLERLTSKLGVESQVFFEGEQDALAYYALADLVLVPSFYEGYGMVIVEALAAGKPVLATDVGVAREAGAIVASPEKFADMLASWFAEGMRAGKLLNYPYQNFDAYVKAWCDDIKSSSAQSSPNP